MRDCATHLMEEINCCRQRKQVDVIPIFVSSKIRHEIHSSKLPYSENIYSALHFPGSGQGLKLTINIEKDEYMSGPLGGSGMLVGRFLPPAYDVLWKVMISVCLSGPFLVWRSCSCMGVPRYCLSISKGKGVPLGRPTGIGYPSWPWIQEDCTWGAPPPHIKIQVDSLCNGWYASCGHAGGLCCEEGTIANGLIWKPI